MSAIKKLGGRVRVFAGDSVSRPGSRNGWWMQKCRKHGVTSHNSIVGCEACQRDRLGEVTGAVK